MKQYHRSPRFTEAGVDYNVRRKAILIWWLMFKSHAFSNRLHCRFETVFRYKNMELRNMLNREKDPPVPYEATNQRWAESQTPPLLGSQNTGSFPLGSALPLVAPLKGCGAVMVTAQVVKVLDLVDTDDPVLAGKRFFEGGKLWPFSGQSRASDAVHGLTLLEESVIVVVGHFVPAGYH